MNRSLIAIALAALASSSAAQKLSHEVSAKGSGVLYQQGQNSHITSGVNSQNYETAKDAFDDELADDFVVPAGATFLITEVDAEGFYLDNNHIGPVRSWHVRFYGDAVGQPGDVVADYDNLTGVVGQDAERDSNTQFKPFWIDIAIPRTKLM